MDDVSRMVARQYEAYAYPAPFADLAARLAEGYFEYGNPADYRALLWPEGQSTHAGRRLAMLAAGCGTVQAAYLASTNPECDIVGVDLSQSSLAHERYLQERHGLTNLRLYQGDLRRVHEIGQVFDYIVCSGVLHHLADPDEGLRALAQVLAPGGAMTLMLYGTTARTGVYMLQDALRRLQVGQDATGVAFARRLVDQLPERHFVRWYQRGAAELAHDSAFVDTFLHAQDRAYTVPQVLGFLERNGLAFQGWVDNALYYPDAALAGFEPEVRAAVAALAPREQWAVVEMLTLNLGMHMLAARRADHQGAPAEPDFSAADWQRLVPSRAPGLRRVVDEGTGASQGASGSIRYRRGAMTIELGPGQAALLEGADGSRRIGELLAMGPLAQLPSARREPLARDFLAQMWRLGHLMFARPAPP